MNSAVDAEHLLSFSGWNFVLLPKQMCLSDHPSHPLQYELQVLSFQQVSRSGNFAHVTAVSILEVGVCSSVSPLIGGRENKETNG